uniref:Uncharacterized protein n=1 Tax=Callorhinchus milii TaxID=7868 RepID=A0A4W3IHC0_CALMI
MFSHCEGNKWEQKKGSGTENHSQLYSWGTRGPLQGTSQDPPLRPCLQSSSYSYLTCPSRLVIPTPHLGPNP